MNSAQVHLALNHVPVILSFVGLAMLIVALLLKNNTLTKTSYVIIAIAGIAVIPVFLSGEGTEEMVERLPGVSEAIIEKHEEVAKLAMIAIAAAGILALAAFFSLKWIMLARILKIAVILSAVVSGGLMFQTAHLGGQIRHTEIRNGVTAQNETEAQGNEDERQENEKD